MVFFLALFLFQSPPPVGTVSGGEFAIQGNVQFGADGKPILASGSVLEVKSGRVTLALEKGTVRFCGPMKATVLKGQGLLIAFDRGTVEMESGGEADGMETPLYRISGGHAAVSVGADGGLCVRSTAGTLRVLEQFGAGELFLPAPKAMRLPAAGVAVPHGGSTGLDVGGVNGAEPAEANSCGCSVSTAGSQLEAPKPTTPAPSSASALALQAPSSASALALEAPSPSAPTTQTTLAVPLVFQSRPAGSAASEKTSEAQVTLPVVVTDPKAPRPNKREASPEARPKGPQGAKRGLGARLRAFFRVLFGAGKKPSQSPPASLDGGRIR